MTGLKQNATLALRAVRGTSSLSTLLLQENKGVLLWKL